MRRTYIIAEAGVNHNGDMARAKAMLLAGKNAGVDAVKFQTFVSENLVSAGAKKAEYQKETTGDEESQLAMLKQLELSFSEFRELKKYAEVIGVDFISTPFDEESLDFLDTLDMPFWKIPSGEITNLPYLQKIAGTKKPIILSTGMCELNEIEEALAVFAQYDRNDITLLHCNTEYPTPYQDVNLLAMNALAEQFGVAVGYSDHTKGIEVSLAAVAIGATVIEKHFTLDRNLPGPDHQASLEPDELALMVQAIRHIEECLGTGIKTPSESERKNIAVARKSIVAKKQIRQGEQFSQENLTAKRPGTGISPMRWNEVIGKTAIRDFKEDELIEL